VEYDPIHNRYLASSDNSSIVAIAPDGTLSYFGTGLDANYGMEVMGNTLFAIVGTHVYGYDLTTELEVMDINISGAGFLNGMGSDASTNRIWVSDFSNDRIYEIDASDIGNPTSSMVVSSTLYQPNGVYHDAANNRLLFVTWGTGRVVEVDLTSYSQSLIVNVGVSNIDGIDADNEGNYYLAHWSPAGITKYNNDFSTSENVPVPGVSSPADICYALGPDTLAIPGGNQVRFAGFESTVGIKESAVDNEFNIYPNPVGRSSVLTYQIAKEELLLITLYDVSGKLIAELAAGSHQSGSYTIALAGFDLAEGTYVCKMTKSGITKSLTFIYSK
jgi:sugar lactone lactonase YvrE